MTLLNPSLSERHNDLVFIGYNGERSVFLIDSVSSSNYILIAYSHEKDITKTILEECIPSLQNWFKFDFQLMTYAGTFEDLSEIPFEAEVLLDDFAPVEALRSRAFF